MKYLSTFRMLSLRFLSNYFKNKIRYPRDSFKLLQKQNTRGLQDSGILVNLPQKPDKRSPRFFQTNSKIKHKSSETAFKLLQNVDTRGSWDSCHITSTTRQEVFEILSNYFKNRTQGVPEILSNYFKNKTQGVPEIL